MSMASSVHVRENITGYSLWQGHICNGIAPASGVGYYVDLTFECRDR